MDILKPNLMWIEGRCYRINPHDPSFSGQLEDEEQFEDDYTEDNIECPPDEPDDDFEVERLENGRYKTAFRVPRFYFSFIIGAKGSVRRRLENETRTQIRVPKQGQDGQIVISGISKSGVAAARRRIDLIVMSSRSRQQFTHFISLPMNGEAIKRRFVEFKEKVLEICRNSRGVDETIFQSPDKLHLTLGTMVIMDKDEREKAIQVLHECKEAVIDPMLQNKTLMLSMVGIEYMNDDPGEVDVLYGKVRMRDGSNDILQELADRTVDYFTQKGLMQKQYERVKLHVTLMNTRFRNDDSRNEEVDTSRRRQRPRESFDAVGILKNFEDYNFGDKELNNMHLSLRYSTGPNGYYQATADITFTD